MYGCRLVKTRHRGPLGCGPPVDAFECRVTEFFAIEHRNIICRCAVCRWPTRFAWSRGGPTSRFPLEKTWQEE